MDKFNSRLQRVLETAYNEVPYFNNLINDYIESTDELKPELIHKLPVFNKRTILDIGWENFVSGNYLNENYELRLRGKARLERTSGTTGNPMKILWNNSDFFSSNMNHWKYRSKNFNITPTSRMCTSSKTIPGDDVFYIDPRSNKMTFSIRDLDQDTVKRILEKLNEFQPEWLYLQNSILFALVYFARQNGWDFPSSIRYIEYIGEPLCDYYRKEIAKMIPAPSSNMYGCVETNGISYECNAGKNHLLPDNVMVEIVDKDGNPLPDGETGYVCVTGLHNTAMPMLRYRLNDLASIHSNQVCACGNPNPTIDIKAGRMTEFIILDDPSVYHEAALYCPINSGLSISVPSQDDILFNIKLNALDDYEIQVYQQPSKDINIQKLLGELFRAYSLPNVRFTVTYSASVDHSKPSGLLRMRGAT